MKVVNKRADKGIAKGQMISEGNCGILNFPKETHIISQFRGYLT